MLIDWFTVGAQTLNFLILVWLMKRFLYKPILNAIDTREKRIAKELADADAKKTEAQKERDEFQKKNEEFDQQRAALLTKATDEAKAERQRLLDEARKAADALSAKRQESLINDAHNLNQAISHLTQKEVFSITRKALTDLATVSLEERMGEVFTRRLRGLDDKAKTVLGDALKKNSEPALVRSAFDLPAEQRAAIQNALNETFSAEIHIRFETSPDLVSGIELSSNGQKVGWSIADYLASLEKGVGELLKEKDKPAPKPEVKVEPKPEAPKPDEKPAPKPEVKAEPKPESAPESKTQTSAESKTKAESDPKPEVKPETKSAAKAEPRQQVKAEPKAEAPKPDEKPAPKPEVKAEPKPETAPESKTEAKPESKSKAESDPKPEIKPEAKSEVEAASKPEAKVEPKLETKVESKPEPKSAPEPEEAKPAIKSA
jgi:F-type H+-transporting ATPase subunit b